MSVLLRAALEVALVGVVVRHLSVVRRDGRDATIPHWPESLELPIPGLAGTAASRRPR